MNYYERHLGDYAKDTTHLTMLEHGAYGLLLDRYYSTEQGIPADQAHRLARARSKEEKAAVDAVLGEFFTLSEGVWFNARCDIEIAKFKDAEPDRNAKRENERERQKRSRERRREIFDELRTHGVVPAYDASMSELLDAIKRVTKPPVTPPVTRDATATQPHTQTPVEIQPPPPDGGSPPSAPEPKAPRPSKKCPESFAVTAEMRQWAQAEIPGIDVDLETSKLRDHTFGSARSDWLGTWRNWLRKAVEHQAQRRTTPAAAESFRERDERIAAESVRRLTGGLAHNRHATGEEPREVLPFEAGYVKPATTADTIEGDANVRRIR